MSSLNSLKARTLPTVIGMWTFVLLIISLPVFDPANQAGKVYNPWFAVLQLMTFTLVAPILIGEHHLSINRRLAGGILIFILGVSFFAITHEARVTAAGFLFGLLVAGSDLRGKGIKNLDIVYAASLLVLAFTAYSIYRAPFIF